jgi:hypothetical protein
LEILHAPAGPLAIAVDPGQVWRVGRRPNPWAWTPWQYAGHAGRFAGRWDDPNGSFRTVYAGRDLLSCLLEVLARFRADPLLAEDLSGIDEDVEDAARHPTLPPGTVPLSWLAARQASTALLTGRYCMVTDKESLPTLRAEFLSAALRFGLADLDAAALRLSAPRVFTQRIAAWLYDLHDDCADLLDGVQFESRHGDRLVLFGVFERDEDGPVSSKVSGAQDVPLTSSHPDVVEAFRLHRVAWADRSQG